MAAASLGGESDTVSVSLLRIAVLVAFVAALAACGGGGSQQEAWPPQVQQALDALDLAKKAAEDGDLEGARAAFENARGPVQVVADLVKPVDAKMAANLEGMVLHLDAHFEMGGNAPHVALTVEDFQRMLEEAGEVLKGPGQ